MFPFVRLVANKIRRKVVRTECSRTGLVEVEMCLLAKSESVQMGGHFHCSCSCYFWFISSKCICFIEGCRNDLCCRPAISPDVLFLCFSIQAGTFSLNQITGLFSRMCVGHCLQLCSTTWTCSSHASRWSLARLLDSLHACNANWLASTTCAQCIHMFCAFSNASSNQQTRLTRRAKISRRCYQACRASESTLIPHNKIWSIDLPVRHSIGRFDSMWLLDCMSLHLAKSYKPILLRLERQIYVVPLCPLMLDVLCFSRASLDVLFKTWRKYPMRPGWGRSFSPPRRLGGG